jgi:hypothetical protein
MLALSCQVIGNVGSSTMCFLLEVPSPNSSVPFCIYSACHMFCQHFVILFLLSVVSLLLESMYGQDGISLHCCHG